MPVPHHSVSTDQMPFLPPNQQRQSTEGKSIIKQYRNVLCTQYALHNVHTICPKLHSKEQFLVRMCGNSGCPLRSDDAIEKQVPRSSPFLANDMTIGSSVKSYHINATHARLSTIACQLLKLHAYTIL